MDTSASRICPRQIGRAAIIASLNEAIQLLRGRLVPCCSLKGANKARNIAAACRKIDDRRAADYAFRASGERCADVLRFRDAEAKNRRRCTRSSDTLDQTCVKFATGVSAGNARATYTVSVG